MSNSSGIPQPLAAAERGSGAVRILEEALAILRERRAVDFSEYRRGTIERRLTVRMAAVRVAIPEDYLELLRTSEREVDRLVSSLTIKVSRFYRNAPVFDLLRDEAIPALRQRFPGEPLRAWSAGCAGGEEAYTLAMLLGAGDLVDATDIDEGALALARAAVYGSDAFAEAPAGLVESFAVQSGTAGEFTVKPAVTSRVRFARHDLSSASAAPAGAPYHLICCRNVLIYFARPLQRRALRLLVDSLATGGVLCLGEAEWPLDEPDRLEVVHRRGKVFRRIAGENERA